MRSYSFCFNPIAPSVHHTSSSTFNIYFDFEAAARVVTSVKVFDNRNAKEHLKRLSKWVTIVVYTSKLIEKKLLMSTFTRN